MLETSQVSRTDYTLANAADYTPRDENVLGHGGEGWWVEERRISRLILSVWKNCFLYLFSTTSYPKHEKARKQPGHQRRRRQNILAARLMVWLVEDLEIFPSAPH